ncbi:MAG: exodeoxyribonuclease VII small subunit [Rhodospirillales bacterium]
MTQQDDIGTLSFEAALKELEGIVRRLEDGSGELDEAIGAYERGARLKAHCEAKLAEAQARVERITLKADDSVTASPADLD